MDAIRNLMQHLEIKDLPRDLQDVASECGLGTVKSMMEVFPSTNIYIPNIKNLVGAVKKYLREHYKRKSPRELARNLNLSEPHIRKLIKEIKDEKQIS